MMTIWAEQNLLRSPEPQYYALGLGVALPLAMLGRWSMDDSRKPVVGQFFVIWLLITAVAAYSYPLVPFERRAVEGVHIPLAMLAGAGVASYLVPWLRRLFGGGEGRARLLALALLLAVIVPTNAKLLVDGALTDRAHLSRETLDAFDWIGRNTPRDARVFSGMLMGQHCCRYALRHVHAAHMHLTVRPWHKRSLAREFFAPETENERRREVLREAGCGWVIAEGSQKNVMARLSWLQPLFESGRVAVYRFAESPDPPRLERAR